MATILLSSEFDPPRIDESWLEKSAEQLLATLARPEAELSILLVDDVHIESLNATYRNKPRPTDVLSFAMQEGDFGSVNPDLLGDVVISLDTAERQAREAGWDLRYELLRLLIHGVLHLLGYDHSEEYAETEAMYQKEQELFKKLADML
jgi:rRNA maturation RNase YbeY